jgi:hypothetical protein
MADFQFLRYEVEDASVLMEFLNANPGPGNPSNYTIRFTDAELAAVTTNLQLRNAVQVKLRRKLQAEGIASKLDAFIGMSVTI